MGISSNTYCKEIYFVDYRILTTSCFCVICYLITLLEYMRLPNVLRVSCSSVFCFFLLSHGIVSVFSNYEFGNLSPSFFVAFTLSNIKHILFYSFVTYSCQTRRNITFLDNDTTVPRYRHYNFKKSGYSID